MNVANADTNVSATSLTIDTSVGQQDWALPLSQ